MRLSHIPVLLILALSGCATSGGIDDDIMGRPRIRSVSTPSLAQDGGLMPGQSTVTYVEDPLVVRRLIHLPMEEAWPRILDAYRAEGLVPDGIDVDRRLISLSRFEWSRVRGGLPLSTFLECGVSSTGGPLADGARIIGSIISQVSDEGESAVDVVVRFEAYALPSEGSAGRAQDCVTTGVLEEEILRRIQGGGAALVQDDLNRDPGIPTSDPGSSPGGVEENPDSPVGVDEVQGLSGPPGPFPMSDLYGPGDKVRVRVSRTQRLTGTFIGLRTDSLLLKRSRITRLPIDRVLGLEVRKTRPAPVWAGAFLGVAAGVALATNTSLGITGNHNVQGKLVGGFLGSSLFGTRWVEVPREAYRRSPAFGPDRINP
jgi:hypothetical protein